MADLPSWEEIVNRVTIASNYFLVNISADRWQVTFQRIEAVADSVRELARRSRATWTGPGAQAFYDHLERLAKALDEVTRQHRAVGPALRGAAEHLETAVRTIPIPSWMEEEVRSKQGMYSSTGVIDDIRPGIIRHYLYQYFPETMRSNEDFLSSYSETAKVAYRTLCAQYADDLARIPGGAKVSVPGVRPDTAAPARPGARPGTPPGSGLPGSGQPGSGLPPTGMQALGLPATGLPASTLPTASTPTFTPPELGGLPESPGGGSLGEMPNAGDLAGGGPPLTGGGLAGLGSLGGAGLGGLGGGIGAGVGGGGGAGGVPLPGIGPSVSPTGTSLGGQALGGAPVRLGTAAGGLAAGTAAAAMGVAPTGYGAGGQNQNGGETSTQLYEDDRQIFGPRDQDLPGGVLD